MTLIEIEELALRLRKLIRIPEEETLEKEFASLTLSYSPNDLARAENELISRGENPRNVRKLCVLHASLVRRGVLSGKAEDLAALERKGGTLSPFALMRMEDKGIRNASSFLKKRLLTPCPSILIKEQTMRILGRFDALSFHLEKKEFILSLVEERKGRKRKSIWNEDEAIRFQLSSIEGNLKEMDPWKEKEVLLSFFSLLQDAGKKERILYEEAVRILTEEDLGKIVMKLVSTPVCFLQKTPKKEDYFPQPK
jgi:DUF438 domain-containing protein